jgi:D-3-phosphoglycerate dehydrogenase
VSATQSSPSSIPESGPFRVAIGPSSFAADEDAPARRLRDRGIEIVANPFGRRLTEAEIVVHLREADGLIAGLEPLNRRVLASAPRLRAIARVGIGMENVDLDAARQLDIRVSNTPDAPIEAVAELTMAAMLALARRLPEMNAELHAGRWTKTISPGLAGATVLFVGYGRIGRATAARARAFGARIIVCDPAVAPSDLQHGEETVDLKEGLKRADIVTLHASGAETLIGAAELAAMRPEAILLNSARGELVDEGALVETLESGRLAGAWFDAFRREPYDGPLLRFDNVLLTPHAATYTSRCRLSMELQAVENLLRDLNVQSDRERQP